MSIEKPFNNSNANSQESKNLYVKEVEESRLMATELQRSVETVQSAKYGDALLRLMRRSGDNPGMINSLNHLLDALSHQSYYGQIDKPINVNRQEDLAAFLEETAKALRWTVGEGNRPADLKIDLSKWEFGK